MSSEHATDGEPEAAAATGDKVVSVLGQEIVIEEDFVAFPWRAGLVRAPLAFLVVFVGVFLLASLGGSGDASVIDRLSIIGLVSYNAHNVHAATGFVPELLTPVARPLLDVPVLGRAFRGLVTVGPHHTAPLSHLQGMVAGETETLGHVNFIAQQDTEMPEMLYYLLPPVVLVAVGWEFAANYWDQAATDSPIEVTRFGLALGLGYVLTMLAGTVLFTVQMGSPLAPGQIFIVLPDRFMVLVFGFVYPAVLGSVGAGIVYLQRGPD